MATMAERGAAPATRPPEMEGAGRGRTSPGQERRFRTSREAFVKLARRHYDRLPGAGPKGGARRASNPKGGGVRSRVTGGA